MRELNRDLFDPRTVMEPEYERSPREGNFGFAFNDSNFSDRVLRIEIMVGPSDDKSDGGGGDGCSSLIEWARHPKRRREDMKKDQAGVSLIDNDLNSPDDLDHDLDVDGLFLVLMI